MVIFHANSESHFYCGSDANWNMGATMFSEKSGTSFFASGVVGLPRAEQSDSGSWRAEPEVGSNQQIPGWQKLHVNIPCCIPYSRFLFRFSSMSVFDITCLHQDGPRNCQSVRERLVIRRLESGSRWDLEEQNETISYCIPHFQSRVLPFLLRNEREKRDFFATHIWGTIIWRI